MNKRRILAGVLSTAMVLGTIYIPVLAADEEVQLAEVTETAVEYTDLAAAIEDAAVGGEIQLAEGETAVLPASISKSVSITGAVDADGNPASTVVFDYTGAKSNTAFTVICGDNITLKNINFIVKKSEVTTDHNAQKRFFLQTAAKNFTLENCRFTATGTNAIALCLCDSAVIRDCDFVGGFKQIGDGEIKDDVLIENCSFSQTTYGIHIGAVNGHTVTVRNCDLNGTWNSFGKGSADGMVVIEDSRFNAVSGGYNYLYPHTNMTVSNSVFSDSFGIGENDSNAVVEFNDCTVDGGGKLKDLFDDSSNIFNAVVAIDAIKDSDGKYVSGTFIGDEQKIKDRCLYEIKENEDGSYTMAVTSAAKIGDKYYTTLQEAMSAAQNNDTVTILAGTYEAFETPKKENITIVGETDKAGKNLVTINTLTTAAPTGNKGGIVPRGKYLTLKNLDLVSWGEDPANGKLAWSAAPVSYGTDYGFTLDHCSVVYKGQPDGNNNIGVCVCAGKLTVKDSVIDGFKKGFYNLCDNYWAQLTVTGNTFKNCREAYNDYYSTATPEGEESFVTVTDNKFEGVEYFTIWDDNLLQNNGKALKANTSINTVTVENNEFNGTKFVMVEFAADRPGNNDKIQSDAEVIKTINDSNLEPVASVDSIYYTDLQAAVEAAEPGATVTMLKDLAIDKGTAAYSNYGVCIDKSLTLDGQGHTITTNGTPSRGVVIFGGKTEADIHDVTIKNVTIKTAAAATRAIQIGGDYIKFIMDGVTLDTTEGTGNTQTLTIGGVQEDTTEVIIKNSKISANKIGYAVIVFNPVNMTIDNSSIDGWAALYMKDTWGGGTGTKGSVVDVKNSTLKGTNYQTAGVNDFGVIVIEDDEVEINVKDSKLIAVAENPMSEKVISFSYHPPYSPANENFAKGDKVTVGGNTTIDLIGENAIFMTSLDESNVVSVTGGKFNVEPDADVIEDGYTTYLSNDGYYYVVTDFTMTAAADKAEVKAGDEVKVTVAATGASYTNADWKLRYDPTKLTFVGAELKDGAAEVKAEDYTLAGKIGSVGSSEGDEIASGAILATYTFKAVAQTTSPVTTAVEFIDAHVNTYNMAILLTNVPAKTADADVTVVIDADASVPGTLESQTIEYDGKAHMSNPFVSTESGVVVTYSTEENGNYTTALPAFTKVGSYDVWYKAELAGYNTKTVKVEGAVVIEPKAVTAGVEFAAGATYPEVVIRPTVNGVEDRTYTGTVTVVIDGQTFTFNAADFVYDGNRMAILDKDKAQTVILSKGGEFAVSASYTEGTEDNYKGGETTVTNVNVDLAFADEDITKALKAAVKSEFVYDGTAHGAEIGALPSGWSVKSVTAISGTANPKVTSVADGSVFVQIIFTDDEGRYNDVTVNTVLAVTPAEVKITVGTFEKAYGTADDTITVKAGSADIQVDGLVADTDLGTVTAVRAELGETRGTYAMTASYAPNANYSVTVVNGKLEIGAPKYLVEVVNNAKIHGGDVKSDYVAGYKLILVYTDADRAYFTYGARTLFDVTERGYKYVDDNGVADETNYRHVFGIVVKADGDAPASDYRARVNYTINADAQPERIVYDMDINLDGLYSANDYSAANGIYNALYEEIFAKNMLKADANGDKLVDTDDVNIVKARADR